MKLVVQKINGQSRKFESARMKCAFDVLFLGLTNTYFDGGEGRTGAVFVLWTKKEIVNRN